MPPGFLCHLLLISKFELKRFFATRRGTLYWSTFAIVWYFILIYPLRFTAELLLQEKDLSQHFSFFDFIGFGELQRWSIPEFGVYWHFALLIFPVLSISLASDQIGSDRERGTLRFILMRSSRDRLFFGRFAGTMAIQAILIVASAVSVLVLVLYRDASLLYTGLSNLLAVSVNLICAVFPFTAMMACLSVKVKSARQASVWAILIWTFLAGIISGFASYMPVLAYLKWLIPGCQLSDLAQLAGWQALELAYVPSLQACFLLIVGRWIMAGQAL